MDYSILLNWFIPNSDPFVDYAIKEITRWAGENLLTITVVTNILTALKVIAIRHNRIRDDKILTALIYFVSFRWLKEWLTPNISETTTKKEEVKL